MPLVVAQTRRGLVHNLYRLVPLTWPNNGRNKPLDNCLQQKPSHSKHIPDAYL